MTLFFPMRTYFGVDAKHAQYAVHVTYKKFETLCTSYINILQRRGTARCALMCTSWVQYEDVQSLRIGKTLMWDNICRIDQLVMVVYRVYYTPQAKQGPRLHSPTSVPNCLKTYGRSCTCSPYMEVNKYSHMSSHAVPQSRRDTRNK